MNKYVNLNRAQMPRQTLASYERVCVRITNKIYKNKTENKICVRITHGLSVLYQCY